MRVGLIVVIVFLTGDCVFYDETINARHRPLYRNYPGSGYVEALKLLRELEAK